MNLRPSSGEDEHLNLILCRTMAQLTKQILLPARRYNWHTEGELFGLLGGPNSPKTQEQKLESGVEGYDISQLELLGEDVMKNSEGQPFKGSVKSPRSAVVEAL